MSKSLYFDLTNEEIKTLEFYRKNPDHTRVSNFFNDPTVDGQVEELISKDLLSSSVSGLVNITPRGMSALKSYEQFLEEKSLFELRHKEELESIKSIANSSSALANHSKTLSDLALAKSKKADVKGWIAIVISLLALFLEAIINRQAIFDFLCDLIF